jgi:hypothetical protein
MVKCPASFVTRSSAKVATYCQQFATVDKLLGYTKIRWKYVAIYKHVFCYMTIEIFHTL